MTLLKTILIKLVSGFGKPF